MLSNKTNLPRLKSLHKLILIKHKNWQRIYDSIKLDCKKHTLYSLHKQLNYAKQPLKSLNSRSVLM